MNLRLSGLTAFALLFATNVFADSHEDILEALGKCAAIADDTQRLACYDALAPHVKQVLVTPPPELPDNRPPTVEEQKSWFGFNLGGLFDATPSQQTTPRQFGSEQLPETRAKEETAAREVDSIVAGVTEYAYTPFGKFIVFLDNGQVWRQRQGDADRASFLRTATDNKVKISRGTLGSYNLQINDSDKYYKVERVK